ncbi:MAG: cytochrome c [Xanthobacteraceae bacterium]|nr:cytochrome c [Xanthobacteraceae bacterium]
MMVAGRYLFAGATAALFLSISSEAPAQDAVARGKYLATFGGCTDCHTPGYFFGKPDDKRYLGGSEVGFEIPGLGVFHGPNLTPDKETGLGGWSDQEIITAMTTGVRPDKRILAPIMPWKALAQLTNDDATALVAYLKSIPAVKNKVPGPFGATEKPTSFVMKIVPPPK